MEMLVRLKTVYTAFIEKARTLQHTFLRLTYFVTM